MAIPQKLTRGFGNGTFSGTIIEGDGVTTAMLKRKGIKVTNEEEI